MTRVWDFSRPLCCLQTCVPTDFSSAYASLQDCTAGVNKGVALEACVVAGRSVCRKVAEPGFYVNGEDAGDFVCRVSMAGVPLARLVLSLPVRAR